MRGHERTFGQIKQEILGLTNPSEQEFFRDTIKCRLQDKRDDATSASLEALSSWTQEHLMSLDRERAKPRFGDTVIPLCRKDVMNYFLEMGYGEDYAGVLWETLVYPERDILEHFGPNKFLHPPYVQFRDIYPVHLIELERARDKHGGIHSYIQPDSAVVDLVSLKTYLEWLNDRESSYDEILDQHLNANDRVFWSKLVLAMEQKLGEVVPINEEFFAYYDSASDYFMWRECGRLATKNLVAQVERKERKTRVNAPERSSLEYLAPVVRTQICEGVWYIPDPEELQFNLDSQSFVNIAIFHKCALAIGQDMTQGTYVFSHIAKLLSSESSEFFRSDMYLYRGVFNQGNPGWNRNNIVIETAELLRIYTDMDNGIKVFGFARKAKDLIRRVLASGHQLDFDQQNICYVAVSHDPADEADINYDDPDLY